jgi:hypothetical protein
MGRRGVPGTVCDFGYRAFGSCQQTHRPFNSTRQNMLVRSDAGRLSEDAKEVTDAHTGRPGQLIDAPAPHGIRTLTRQSTLSS